MNDQHTNDEPRTALVDTQQLRRGHAFFPTEDQARAIPALYETEATPAEDKTLHVHYFCSGSDWWVAEYDPSTGLAFGYACIGDPGAGEWGTFDLGELERLNLYGGVVIVERDLEWTPVPAHQANLPGATPTGSTPEPGSATVGLVTGSEVLVAVVQHLCPEARPVGGGGTPGLEALTDGEGLLLLADRLGVTVGRVFIGDDLDDATVWGRALGLRADHVVFLPDAEQWLTDHLRDHLTGPED